MPDRQTLQISPIVVHAKISFLYIVKALLLLRYKEGLANTVNLIAGFTYDIYLKTALRPVKYG